jgi:hypothetical protein
MRPQVGVFERPMTVSEQTDRVVNNMRKLIIADAS